MSVIRILPEKVASQIAAGEVIERPASVVRELMDNSIDAGAEKIFVTAVNGGKSLIRVADDGAGMHRDDLLLCLERHATSKIGSVSDLFAIHTLGFRGEALPSISAVSKLEILSRRHDALIGHRLKVRGGKIKSLEETGAPAGTTVEAADLFFNTPARRKFLRASSTETDHILDTFARIALPFASIHFRLDEGDRTLLNLPASPNEINRLAALFGREVAGSMGEHGLEQGAFKLRCYAASPEATRARGDRMFVYVNKRNVKDRLLTHAVMEGYGQRLMKGRYPQVVLFMEMDPSLVDVNVHPTKQEVRFREGKQIHDTIRSTINKALGERLYASAEIKGDQETGREGQEDFLFSMGEAGPAYRWEKPSHGLLPSEEGNQGSSSDRPGARLFGDRLEIIGQLKNTYLLCEGEDGFLMIDQHAAHERVLYEKLRRAAAESETQTQPFLLPPTLELPVKEARILSRHLDQLKKVGIEIEPFGGNAFLVRSVPAVMVRANWMDFLKELSPILEKSSDLSGQSTLDETLNLMACHGAIRAGARLSFDEMSHLLRELDGADLPSHCPHGRPIFRKFTFYEIEKMFKRVV
jgi:DNA mismatch repair protein MutL